MLTIIIWALLAGLSYGVTIGEDKPSVLKQIGVGVISAILFPLFLGLALKDHMDNVNAIRKHITEE
jgi:hypothetical protein